MTIFLWVFGALLLAIHLYRRHWANKHLPQVGFAEFSGELYRVGDTCIARRLGSTGNSKTVICFPGFLEDMRYFTALYEETDCELILVNNARYHCAFDKRDVKQLDWPENPFAVGLIEHDGFYLAQVVRELASGSEVVLHGHSRGGAVVLEAGRQFPQLMRDGDTTIRAILEAPVLPQASVAGNGSDPLPHYLIRYFLPVVLGLSRNQPAEKMLRQPMMRPSNDLKLQVCHTVYTNPAIYKVCVTNVKSIRDWQRRNYADLYCNYRQITVVMGERDDVLDNPSMLASAQAGAARAEQAGLAGVDILQTENTNHFPALEQPHYLRELAGVG